MCLIPGCSRSNLDGSNRWGLSSGLCQHHFAEIRAEVTDGERVRFGNKASFLDDFVRLKALMIDKKQVMACMKQLNKELVATINLQRSTPDDLDDRFNASHGADRNYVRLSRVLEYYECYCWYPSSHVLFAGGLSPSDFNWYLAHGYMPKDPGAGANHGDFSHRLQWHAVMRVVTDGFSMPKRSGRNHTPFELYTEVGSEMSQARRHRGKGDIWGYIFDNAPNSTMRIGVYDRRGDKNGTQDLWTYSDPSNLHLELLEKTSWTALVSNCARRFHKRDDLRQRCNDWIERTWNEKGTGHKVKYKKPIADWVAGSITGWKAMGGRRSKWSAR